MVLLLMLMMMLLLLMMMMLFLVLTRMLMGWYLSEAYSDVEMCGATCSNVDIMTGVDLRWKHVRLYPNPSIQLYQGRKPCQAINHLSSSRMAS